MHSNFLYLQEYETSSDQAILTKGARQSGRAEVVRKESVPSVLLKFEGHTVLSSISFGFPFGTTPGSDEGLLLVLAVLR